MVNVSVCVPVPLPLVALRVMLYVPVVVGVPEIKPETVSILRPAGKGAAPQVVIGWSAVIWYEYGTPMVPLSEVGLVIFGFGAANAVLVAPSSAIVNTAIPNARPVPALGSLEFEEPEVMVWVQGQRAMAKTQMFHPSRFQL